MLSYPEYSFVQFSNDLDDCQCCTLLEVAEASDLSFYINYPLSYERINVLLESGALALSGNTFVEVVGYRRTSSAISTAIRIDRNKEYYFTGSIQQIYERPIYGVMFYDKDMNNISGGVGGINNLYNRMRLEIPKDAVFLVSCSYQTDPVIEISSKAALFLCDISGQVIASIGGISRGWTTLNVELSDYIACGDCFRLLVIESDVSYYSNTFLYNPTTNHSFLTFRSDNTSFFPFEPDKWMSLRLPIRLINRNSVTEKEEYIDANGHIWNPIKQRRDKYDLETDYSTDDFHKKLEIILLHEEILIDDMEINETGDYQINYEDELSENEIKLHKASSEISTHEVTRMRNY